MKKQIDNYKDFDKLSLYVKKYKAEEIIEHYKKFKWKLVDQSENNRYEDIIDLTFIREHKIENKDELQLLQVYMEERLNNVGKLEKNKNAKSTSFGLFFGAIGTFLFIFGLMCCFQCFLLLNLFTSIVFSCIGLILIIICAIFLPKIIKKEKSDFIFNKKKVEKEIDDICNKALSLTGGDKNENA